MSSAHDNTVPSTAGTPKKGKGQPKAVADGDDKAPVFSQDDARLCIELLITAAQKGGCAIRPDWSALAEKLDIVSGAAA